LDPFEPAEYEVEADCNEYAERTDERRELREGPDGERGPREDEERDPRDAPLLGCSLHGLERTTWVRACGQSGVASDDS
jgi:hypothetical protein